jgi:hypothetical protein
MTNINWVTEKKKEADWAAPQVFTFWPTPRNSQPSHQKEHLWICPSTRPDEH